MKSNDNQQVSSLLLRVRAGDEGAFGDLLEMYEPLVKGIVRRFSLDEDDLYSEACMAFYKAALNYDLSQNEVTFGLYANVCITNRMCDLVRSDSRRPLLVDDKDVDAIAVEGGILPRLVREESRREFRRVARALLSDYEFSVLSMWLKGEKTADIANSLSVSAKSVDNAKARILKKLREGLPPSAE